MNTLRPSRLALILAALFLASCSATSVESTWEVPGYHDGGFQKLAVVALLRDESESAAFETAAVGKLAGEGVEAFPAFSVLARTDHRTLEALEARLDATDANAILIFKVIALDANWSYAPPTKYVTTGVTHAGWFVDAHYGYYSPYPHHYWGYYYPAAQVIGADAYWETHTSILIESALYRTSDNKLIWTARTTTLDVKGEQNLANSVAPVIVNTLKDTGLLTAR